MERTSFKPAKHVLIVDDDRLIRELIAEWLCIVGYGTAVACDGEDAMRRIHGLPVDLVITDMCMPLRGGSELIAGLRLDHPDVRIIAMSASFGADPSEEQTLTLGAHEVLSKPFTREELLGSVRSLIGTPR